MSPEPARRTTALADLLKAETALFAELAELAGRQRAALLGADEARLQTLAAQAETLATRFRLLEDERARLETPDIAHEPAVERARSTLVSALGRLLRESSVSGIVLARLEDTVAARRAAVGGLFGTTYLPDGRTPDRGVAAGTALCARG